MNLHAARNMFNFMEINIIEYCSGKAEGTCRVYPTGMYRVVGYYRFFDS